MATFNCKVCGSIIEADDITDAVCQYCGVKQTMPVSECENYESLTDSADAYPEENSEQDNSKKRINSIKLIIFTLLFFILGCAVAIDLHKITEDDAETLPFIFRVFNELCSKVQK